MATEASYTRFERAASPTATTTTEDPKRNNDDANNGQANDDSDAEQKDVEAGCALARGRRAARAADTEWRLKVLMLVGGACGVYVLNLVALALYDALDFEERLAAQSLSAPCLDQMLCSALKAAWYLLKRSQKPQALEKLQKWLAQRHEDVRAAMNDKDYETLLVVLNALLATLLLVAIVAVNIAIATTYSEGGEPEIHAARSTALVFALDFLVGQFRNCLLRLSNAPEWKDVSIARHSLAVGGSGIAVVGLIAAADLYLADLGAHWKVAALTVLAIVLDQCLDTVRSSARIQVALYEKLRRAGN